MDRREKLLYACLREEAACMGDPGLRPMGLALQEQRLLLEARLGPIHSWEEDRLRSWLDRIRNVREGRISHGDV